MHLLDLISPARISAGVSASSKKRLLEVVADLLIQDQPAELDRPVFDSLCARERLGSTGLGHGVAIPHGRTPGLATATGAFVRLREPLDFGAPDGEPVDLVFALAVPEHFTHQHLVLLSQLADMFGDASFRDSLRKAPDSAAIHRLLSDWQAAHAAA
ncbi:PTS sugar transporter subunit IIA [Alkalisalibacterium limincola]|uniref:PTS sugar transporter subunit IIA n=1 Tax=Alkalisalibacterium limincola TaxID=2699169 RepID=A0A5C8KZ16_9GAMM|nr:PTS sugar transporter subunit IIA [Alkalisalibacterium limincola]TXK65073.1 PTS sugar transporter subunit IIA [Alkalisalibacterium limincola]